MDVQFGAYCLKARERQLIGPQGPIDLDGRSVDVLRALLAKPNELVMKDEIFAAVWPGIAVGENTLQVHISSLRKALGPDIIETVHGRGYKYRGAWPEFDAGTTAPGRLNGERPAIAVQPFRNSDGGEDYSSLCHGLTGALVEQLSRFTLLSVVPQPALSPQEQNPEAEVRKALPDFHLTGDVRRSGSRIRATAKLQDSRSQVVIWAEHYDRSLDDEFAVLDELSGTMAGRLSTRIDSHMATRQVSTRSVTSYDHLIKGIWHFRQQTAEAPAIAELLFRKARELNQGNAEAIRWLSIHHTCQWLRTHKREALLEALALGRAAAELDPGSATCHAAHGFAQLWGAGAEIASTSFRKAYAANPNDGYMLADVGLCSLYQGHLDEAYAILNRAEQLNPYPSDWHSQYRSMGKFVEGNYAEAIPGLQRLPMGVFGLVYLLSCHGHLGNGDQAGELVSKLQALDCDPVRAAEDEPFADAAVRNRLTEGVRTALALAGIR